MRLGSHPPLFWQPWLGHFFHLGPDDMKSVFITTWVSMFLDVQRATAEKN